jgi:hypothetical protein
MGNSKFHNLWDLPTASCTDAAAGENPSNLPNAAALKESRKTRRIDRRMPVVGRSLAVPAIGGAIAQMSHIRGNRTVQIEHPTTESNDNAALGQKVNLTLRTIEKPRVPSGTWLELEAE